MLGSIHSHHNINDIIASSNAAINLLNNGHSETRALLAQAESLSNNISSRFDQAHPIPQATVQLASKLAAEITKANRLLSAATNCFSEASDKIEVQYKSLQHIQKKLKKGRILRKNQTSSDSLVLRAGAFNEKINDIINTSYSQTVYNKFSAIEAIHVAANILKKVSETI